MKINDQKDLWHRLFKEKYFVETYPAEQVVGFLMRYKKNNSNAAKVLDLGCGVGRHTLLAAEIGFDAFEGVPSVANHIAL